MKGNEIFGSGKYLKAAALLNPDGSYGHLTLTIKGRPETKEFDDGKSQRVIGFAEDDRKLGLNKTNWNMISKITGKDDDDEWDGARIELWVDENVQYAGEIIPGIRIRRPAAAQQAAKPTGYDKISAFAKWKELGGDAGAFKPQAEAVAKDTGVSLDKFTNAEWCKVLDACLPF